MQFVEVPATAVPTDETVAIAGNIYLARIRVSNTHATNAITFLVKDGNGVILLPTVSLLSKSYNLITYPEGTEEIMLGGVVWQAGAAGLVASLLGYKP